MSDTGPATWRPQMGPQMPMTRNEAGQQRIGERDRYAVANTWPTPTAKACSPPTNTNIHSTYSAVVVDDLAPICTADAGMPGWRTPERITASTEPDRSDRHQRTIGR